MNLSFLAGAAWTFVGRSGDPVARAGRRFDGDAVMLLWEALGGSSTTSPSVSPDTPAIHTVRLPFDMRCVAQTKLGVRCRGRILKGREYCFFHDPDTASRRQERLASARSRHRRLSHLPDGYLRKLTSLSAVGHAMDRLYREVRLEIITPEMGRVMFGILTRLADTGLVKTGKCPDRSKAARLRPKMKELLTRAERMAWRKAVANADPKKRETRVAPPTGGRAPNPAHIPSKLKRPAEPEAPLVFQPPTDAARDHAKHA